MAILVVMVVCCCSWLFCQTTSQENLQDFLQRWGKGQKQDPREMPVYLATGAMEIRQEPYGMKIWIGTEGVHIWQGESEKPILEMVCDQAVIWFKPLPKANHEDKADQALADTSQGLSIAGQKAEQLKFYAEGNVHFRWADHYFRGERIFFDLLRNQGIVSDGSLRTSIPTEKQALNLYIRAEEFVMLSKEESIAQRTSISGCGFGHPHYSFQTQELRLIKFSDKVYLQARDNHLQAWGVPFFYIPYIAGENIENWPLKSFQYGHSSKWGHYVLTTWGGDLYTNKSSEVGLSKVQWLLDLDTRSERGLAGGPQILYKGTFPVESQFTGQWRAYYIHDQPLSHLGESMDYVPDEDDDATWDRRYRLGGVHRHRFPHDWFLDIEFSRISDRNVLRDFFEKEFREEKEPETYIYARKYWDHSAATLLTRWRVNDFQSQIEYLPQGTYEVIHQPLFSKTISRLYWTSRVEVSEVRRADDKDYQSLWDHTRLFRTDWHNTLSYSFSVGPLHILPFASGRLSYFEKDRDDELNVLRSTGEMGVEVATNFYRFFGWKSEFLELNEVLHVITPRIRYHWIYANSQGSQDLIPIDSMENVDRMQSLDIVLTNRLRTMRKDQVVDFFWLDITLRYFPDLPVTAVKTKDSPWDNWDNVRVDLLWYVRSNLWLRTRAEWDWNVHDFEMVNATIGYDATDSISCWLDHRYERHESSIATASLEYKYNEKWTFSISSQYDFHKTELREVKFMVRRVLHCFALDINVKYDDVDSNTSVTAEFYPLGIGTTRSN